MKLFLSISQDSENSPITAAVEVLNDIIDELLFVLAY